MGKKKDEPKIDVGPKEQFSFTLSPGVKKRFLEYCAANMLNKSQVLEKLIKDFFESKDFEGMKKIN